MTKPELARLLAYLNAIFPRMNRETKSEDAQVTLEIWWNLFKDISYDDGFLAVQCLIANRKDHYPVTPAELMEQILRNRGEGDETENTAWAMVCSAVRNAVYCSREEFEGLHEDIREAVGSPDQLREWALMEDLDAFQTVVASNFKRVYRTIRQRKREKAMLPPELNAQIAAAKGFCLKGENEKSLIPKGAG